MFISRNPHYQHLSRILLNQENNVPDRHIESNGYTQYFLRIFIICGCTGHHIGNNQTF